MPPTIRTVRRTTAAWLLLVLAALTVCVPASTIAGAAPDRPVFILARPDNDGDDDEGDGDGDDEEDLDLTLDGDGVVEGEEEDDDEGDDSETDEVDEDELPDNVKAILKKERKARRDAEKRARAAERAAKKPKPKPKDTGKDTDDDTSDEPDTGTLKLRQVNVRAALEKKGYSAQRARTVARLLDDLDFDDEDEPTNLDDAIADAIDEHGEDIAGTGQKPKPKPRRKAPATNGRDGNNGGGKGPKLTAAELEAAKQQGLSPEQYDDLRKVTTPQDYDAYRRKWAKGATRQ